MPLAELRGVSKRFGEHPALLPLDLSLERGEVVGLLGPNGAGKTTAVRILCGLLRPDAGEVSIDGHDVLADPLRARRALGFVPDGAPLYPNLSAEQHLLLVGRLHGLDDDRVRAETARLLGCLGLAERAGDPVGQFSRGMRQKVALACAVIHRPPLLVLDEPLSGLDAPTTSVFKAVLRAWADDGGCVLYTSHLLDVVERVCDRMAILAGGRLVGLGTLAELRQRAGRTGTLEEVFTTLAATADPELVARELLGKN